MAVELTPEAKDALTILRLKLSELLALGANSKYDGSFDRWHMTTSEILKRFLNDTQYRLQFLNIRFSPVGYWDANAFVHGRVKAQSCLEAAIEHIERFGLDEHESDELEQIEETVEGEEPDEIEEVRHAGGGLHIYGDIKNLAIAMHSATQNVNQTVNEEVATLREIGDILRNSGELRQREVAQALDVITKLATELHKSRESWNWRNVLDWSNTLLSIANNATDAATKLAPYLPVLVGLYETAAKMLK